MQTRLFSPAHRSSVPVWRRLLPLLALFVTFGTSFQARAQANSSITGSSIIVDRGAAGGNVGNETYDGRDQTARPDFDGANLGSFNVSNFNTTLILNGGSLSTTQSGPDDIRSAILFYEVTNADGSPTNGLQQIRLAAPTNSTGNKTFFADMANVSLLAGSGSGGQLAPGDYFVEVSFRANGFNTATSKSFNKNDPDGFTYQARFTVTGVRPAEPPTSTTWTGGKNDNWFDRANWSNGIPDRTKNTTIPDFGSGSTVLYPNIYSNAIKPASVVTTTMTNSDGTTSPVETVVPGYDNTDLGPAETLTFTMQGTATNKRAITNLVVGRLNVLGDFNNQLDSFQQSAGTTIGFIGTQAQTISGSGTGLVNVDIDGGGVKTLTENFTVKAGGTLRFINGILRTISSTPNTSYVRLAPSTNDNNAGVPSGRIDGEKAASFLRGLVVITEEARVGQTESFGNIGLALTFIGNPPGQVTVQRSTDFNYESVTNDVDSKPSIRRSFRVLPGNSNSETGGLNATLTFRYLDNELTNLDPNNQTLDESKLALYISTQTGGNVFAQLGRDMFVESTNTLTKTNVTSFGTFTLSELSRPLPVALTAFNAKRVGNNAEITWETVSEINSRGYDVQVSNDGRTFRTLAFVPSASANSNQLQRYRYTDNEAGKSGVRYYRLRQIDLDGTDHYYAPKAVTFDGGADLAKAEVRAFPNPFGQVLTLTTNSKVAGPAQVSITDMTGRTVGQYSLDITAGVNDIAVPNAANLRSGMYLVRLVLPSGEAKVIRVNKE